MSKLNEYYSVGNESEIVISNSSLSQLNTNQGGGIKKFLKFFSENKEEKKSKSLERGKILHSYIEKPEDFVVEDLDKPSESLCLFCKKIVENVEIYLNSSKLEISEEVPQDCKELYEMISMTGLGNPNLSLSSIREIVISAREDSDYNRTIKKEQTLLKKITELNTLLYLKFLTDNSNKIVLSNSDKEKIDNAIIQLKDNKYAKECIIDKSKEGYKIYKEIAIYFEIFARPSKRFPTEKEKPLVKIKCKCLIDNLKIKNDFSHIEISDLKTTNKSIFEFEEGSLEYFHYYRQLPFYKLGITKLLLGKGKAFDSDGNEIEFKILSKEQVKKIDFDHYFIVQELIEPYRNARIYLDDSWIKKGINEYKSLIEKYAWHFYEDQWEKDFEIEDGLLRIKSYINIK